MGDLDIKKKMRGGHQVRMGDVARAAGVSSITVSRTLLTPEKVAPETRRRVESAIRRLRYVPNLAAGTLASSRSRIVAVIVPNMANSVFAETLQGMSDILRKADYHLLIGNSGYSLAPRRMQSSPECCSPRIWGGRCASSASCPHTRASTKSS